MAENLEKWPSGHGQLTKIRLSDGSGRKTITTAARSEYDRHGFEGYLGNVGLVHTTTLWRRRRILLPRFSMVQTGPVLCLGPSSAYERVALTEHGNHRIFRPLHHTPS